MFFNFSLSIFISKKFSAKFLEVDFETHKVFFYHVYPNPANLV